MVTIDYKNNPYLAELRKFCFILVKKEIEEFM